jgi:membrane-associated protease RseP (regulator of RpoE activity)
MSKPGWAGALLALFWIVAAPALADPGASPEGGFGAEITMLRRMNRIVWPILVVAAPRCERLGLAGATIGIAAVNIVSFPPERRAWARNLLTLGLRPRVLFVPDGTPAHDAGIREGDAIVAVNGAAIAETDDAPNDITRRVKDAIKVDAPIRIDVARDTGTASATVRPVTVCRLAIHATESADIEATFKGDRATISKGLSQFATEDRDLAVILAHGVAHVILEAETAGPATLRFTNAGSPEVERAADKLSLELTAAAGYPVDRAAELWERLKGATPAPSRASLAALHPITPERLAALRAASAQARPSQAPILAERRDGATQAR